MSNNVRPIYKTAFSIQITTTLEIKKHVVSHYQRKISSFVVYRNGFVINSFSSLNDAKRYLLELKKVIINNN